MGHWDTNGSPNFGQNTWEQKKKKNEKEIKY